MTTATTTNTDVYDHSAREEWLYCVYDKYTIDYGNPYCWHISELEHPHAPQYTRDAFYSAVSALERVYPWHSHSDSESTSTLNAIAAAIADSLTRQIRAWGQMESAHATTTAATMLMVDCAAGQYAGKSLARIITDGAEDGTITCIAVDDYWLVTELIRTLLAGPDHLHYADASISIDNIELTIDGTRYRLAWREGDIIAIHIDARYCRNCDAYSLGDTCEYCGEQYYWMD